ncbi:MAG TPA: zinc ABC transporter substrate-binding protein [Candidatus Saccharimonadales bacterium]|nr:zinc ABC transporter substrate-binding protein [Candidatus Saccharimonadales bacterium]
MKPHKIVALAGLVVLVGLLAFGMYRKNQSTQPTNHVSVSASFYPLYDFARNVGGSHVSVTNITPAGAEPHDYEPSAQDLVQAQKSAVFLYNGGTMEPWTDKFVKDYQHVVVKASSGIALHTATLEGESGVKDPHFWLDPVLAQQIVRNIRDGLIKADPKHRVDYTKNAAAYIAKLQTLDRAFSTGLQQCQQHTIITSHEAFGYVAARYHFTAQSIAGLSPDSEPSAGKMAELAQLARQQNIHYIFFESLVSPRLADTIAQEVGAKTLVFDPLEGLTNEAQKQGQNYLSVQQQNLAALRTALACH